VQTRSERLKDAVDRAYLEKYHTPGSIKFARDLVRAKSRATTTELVPLEKRAASKHGVPPTADHAGVRRRF
jgi:hypothetical protein